jgi:hypothetical protein
LLAVLAIRSDPSGGTREQRIHYHPLSRLEILDCRAYLAENSHIFVSDYEGEGDEGRGGGAVVEADQVNIASADARHFHLDLHPIRMREARLWHIQIPQQGDGSIEGRGVEMAHNPGKGIPDEAVLKLDGFHGGLRIGVKCGRHYTGKGLRIQPQQKWARRGPAED